MQNLYYIFCKYYFLIIEHVILFIKLCRFFYNYSALIIINSALNSAFKILVIIYIMRKKHYCDYCNYDTDRLSSYKDHLKSKKHIKNSDPQNSATPKPHHITPRKDNHDTILKNKCKHCNVSFSRPDSLNRHIRICSEKKYIILISELKNKVTMLENIIKAKDESIKIGDKVIDTVNESVKKGSKSIYNIVINQIKEPIPLKQLENVKLIHGAYKDNEMNEFVKDICSMYQNGSLYKFIGNFIIKQYKKDDIVEQSLFSTDSSRSNFIYSTIDKDNKAVWKKDPKGLKVGSITLDNILMHIQDIIGEEQLKMVKTLSRLSEYEVLKLSDIISTCNKIDRLIRHNNELKNKIVSYLSANFGFDERDLFLCNS